MKTSLLSFAVALGLFATTTSFAASPKANHHDDRRTELARRKEVEARRRYELAQRKQEQERQRQIAMERARLEARRNQERRLAAERARREAARRYNDRHDDRRSYSYNRH
ncbi:hypothetical protein H8B15_06650 [Hymenobacter sp. BT507]|uniref:ATP-dependent DNA helicase n=1 Tax=Hymenobacter citatus TaxID=2763506 RepID=A0ABR7MI13_9BACT|nr:hypothetical protein [Hymenobacter citatus]MBC6610593.1 hypothetical protein [Hymenobacter citatus]